MRANREVSFKFVFDDCRNPKPTEEELSDLWTRCGCDYLERGLDYFVLDTATDATYSRLSGWLNSLAGQGLRLEVDDGTLHYVTKLEPKIAIRGLEFYRRRSLQSHPDWARLGPIWTNRVNRVKRRALKMVAGEL